MQWHLSQYLSVEMLLSANGDVAASLKVGTLERQQREAGVNGRFRVLRVPCMLIGSTSCILYINVYYIQQNSSVFL